MMLRQLTRTARSLPFPNVAIRDINTKIHSIYPDGPSYDYRQNNKMMIRGFDVRREQYVPILDLSASSFHPEIIRLLEEKNLKTPTPTQAQGWPIVLSGKDCIVVSKTGTGKTFTYLAPVFHYYLTREASPAPSPGVRTPKVLILSRLRDSALEIGLVTKKFADLCGMKTTVTTGGYEISEDVKYLKSKGADVLVATPGRCAALHRIGALDLSQVEKVILDEGHVLLNVVQKSDTKHVLKNLNKKGLQTIAVGARWTQECRDYEPIFAKKDMIFLQVLRKKRDLSGEPTARAIKSAQPSRRRRMVARWKLRDQKIRESEKLAPEVTV